MSFKIAIRLQISFAIDGGYAIQSKGIQFFFLKMLHLISKTTQQGSTLSQSKY